MRCLICGRELKNPKSIERGYGPMCYRNKFVNTVRIRHRNIESVSKPRVSFSGEVPGQMTLSDFLQMES